MNSAYWVTGKSRFSKHATIHKSTCRFAGEGKSYGFWTTTRELDAEAPLADWITNCRICGGYQPEKGDPHGITSQTAAD